MHAFWVILGIAVLALGFLDVFLTALNYDEAGFLATPLCRLQWRCLRSITRRLSRRWRPAALRQVTGLQIVLSVTTWLGCIVIGFGFIYYGLMSGTSFEYDGRGVGAGMFSAMYLSAAQLSTVGTSQISPQTDTLRVLTILETLSAPLLVTLILTFLLGVYQVVRDLRTLSGNFLGAQADTGDAIASLAPYFPQGQPTGLDSHLQAISASFWSYADGVRLHHIAYYFQSGRDQFSLPYTLHMMGRMLAALRWGLPPGHPASAEPALMRLILQFERFADYLHDDLDWTSAAVPEVVSFEDFSAARRSADAAPDIWVGRFLRLTRDMERLARLAPADDPQDLYQRYRQWLPFAYRAEQVAAAVSRDLDYQPLARDSERVRERMRPGAGSATAAGSPLVVKPPVRPWRPLLNRWMAVPDPGFSRLAKAGGATLAAAAAVVTLYLLFTAAGMPVMPSAMFGGMVGMQAASMPGDATAAGRKRTTLLTVLPALGGAALSAAVAPSFTLSAVALVLLVLPGVWIGGFGPRLAALGQIAFMSFYFGLVLHFRFALLPSLALAAAVGMVWAWLFRFVLIAERPDRVLRSGLDAFRAQLVLFLDPLVDAVSGARWDPDIRKRVDARMRRLHRCAAFLQGELRAIDPAAARPQADELRLLLFDTELAANNVTAMARQVAGSGTVVPVALRGQLAGMLDRAQERLRGAALSDRAQAENTLPPASWPEPARRLHDSIDELLHAAGTLRNAQTAALADPGVAAREVTADTSPRAPEQPVSGLQGHGLLAPASRQAIQAAVATGLALLAGAAVTAGNQYWAALAAFLVLGGTETVEETIVKGLQRIAGTLAGAVIGFGVALHIGTDPAAILPLLGVCVFAALYFRPVSYTLMAFWITMMLALLYEFLGTLTTEKLEIRVLETAIGAVIAFGAATLLLPTRTRQKMNGDAVAFLRALDDIIQACLERLAGSAASPSLSDQALALDQRFRRLSASAAPLRRTAGALRLDGMERRLTAAAALVYYARHLVKATEASVPGAAALPAPAQLAAFTRDNLHALIRVLKHELPGPLHESEDLPFPADASRDTPEEHTPEREAAHYLARINQTVLTLIEDLARDTAESAGAVNSL